MTRRTTPQTLSEIDPTVWRNTAPDKRRRVQDGVTVDDLNRLIENGFARFHNNWLVPWPDKKLYDLLVSCGEEAAYAVQKMFSGATGHGPFATLCVRPWVRSLYFVCPLDRDLLTAVEYLSKDKQAMDAYLACWDADGGRDSVNNLSNRRAFLAMQLELKIHQGP